MCRLTAVVVFLALVLAACSPEVQQDEKPSAVPEGGRTAVPENASNEPAAGGEAGGALAPVREDAGEPDTSTPPREVEKPAATTVDEDLRKEVEELRAELGENYLAGIEGPFIVLGNIPEERFRQIMRYTIRACSQAMHKQYFEKKPDYTIRIYLFGDDASYRRTARRLWGDTDLSPFGYYKPSEKTLVMNIATGTGTLVHEMFHALVEPDFPDIPSWFNEGVASLYECCRVGEDRLIGLMNWRFPRLQKALRDDELVPLKRLVFTSTSQFYGRGSDLHYSEARYFCMYLQEKGLLEKFYRKFRDNYETDPTGKTFLEEILGKKIEEIEKDWVKWVKTLKHER